MERSEYEGVERIYVYIAEFLVTFISRCSFWRVERAIVSNRKESTLCDFLIVIIKKLTKDATDAVATATVNLETRFLQF